jgi:hypothetical protein
LQVWTYTAKPVLLNSTANASVRLIVRSFKLFIYKLLTVRPQK